MKVGTYFDDFEFACKCGRHGYDGEGHPILDHIIDKRLVDVLDAIRERIGQPIEVLSGYRCLEHNAEGINVDYLAEVAEECGADGIGRYYNQDFVHVDVRGWAARWTDQD